ncbi:hypothetical protein scyTo_0000887 [Scyliorhinus torazame]|uniref:Histone H2A n=1 Tax=Scyliorhinus torazame TaxID=75743 RepID=A0A401P5S3_SCYTO|nr:hypothetical protein [Scyliorhinus torazame]
MSGHGKTRGKGCTEAKTRFFWADLLFTIGCIYRLLRKGHYAQRMGTSTPAYPAVVLEYQTAEILELNVNVAWDNTKTHTIPHHLQLTIRNGTKLNKLLGRLTITQGGILPNIQAVLLPRETGHPSKVYA